MSTETWTHDGATTPGHHPTTLGAPRPRLVAGAYDLCSDEGLSNDVSGVRPISRKTQFWRSRFLLRLVAVAVAICAAIALMQSLAQLQ